MVEKSELRLFGNLMRMDSNSKPRQVQGIRDERPRGKERPRIQLEDHMGTLAWKTR
jgi:hypothetical protein